MWKSSTYDCPILHLWGAPQGPLNPPGGYFFLNVKLEHMSRLHKKELLAQNALKAQEMKISLDSSNENIWFAHFFVLVGKCLM